MVFQAQKKRKKKKEGRKEGEKLTPTVSSSITDGDNKARKRNKITRT